MALEPRDIYKRLNDEQLFIRMSNGDEKAFEELYIRHRRFVYGVCRRRYATSLITKLGFHGCEEDMVQTIFIKAWRYARSFDAGGEQDPEKIKKRVQKWLCKIALNSFRDIWSKHTELWVLHLESDWEWDKHLNFNQEASDEQSDSPTDKAVPHGKRFRLALEAIEKVLSPGEQQLINAALEYYPKDMPSWLQRDLAELLNIQQSSLRQTKRRAIKKIIKYVESQPDWQDEEDDDQENTDR